MLSCSEKLTVEWTELSHDGIPALLVESSSSPILEEDVSVERNPWNVPEAMLRAYRTGEWLDDRVGAPGGSAR